MEEEEFLSAIPFANQNKFQKFQKEIEIMSLKTKFRMPSENRSVFFQKSSISKNRFHTYRHYLVLHTA